MEKLDSSISNNNSGKNNPKEFIQVFVRIRPALHEIFQSFQSGNDQHALICTSALDDRTIKITALHFCRCPACKSKYGIYKIMEVFGSSRDKTDKIFKFDRVFGEEATQDEVYQHTVGLLDHAIKGYTSTLFSFGPTYGGKTYTMFGTDADLGIIPRTIYSLFNKLKIIQEEDSNFLYDVEISYVELHRDTFRNLIRKEVDAQYVKHVHGNGNLESGDPHENGSDRIEIHENPTMGVFLAGNGLRIPVKTPEDAISLIKRGDAMRVNPNLPPEQVVIRYM